jgi:hypothetical protein
MPRRFQVYSTTDFKSSYNPSQRSWWTGKTLLISTNKMTTKRGQSSVAFMTEISCIHIGYTKREILLPSSACILLSVHAADNNVKTAIVRIPSLAGWLNEPDAVCTDSGGRDVGNVNRDNGLVVLHLCSYRNMELQDDLQYDEFILNSNSTTLRARRFSTAKQQSLLIDPILSQFDPTHTIAT